MALGPRANERRGGQPAGTPAMPSQSTWGQLLNLPKPGGESTARPPRPVRGPAPAEIGPVALLPVGIAQQVVELRTGLHPAEEIALGPMITEVGQGLLGRLHGGPERGQRKQG